MIEAPSHYSESIEWDNNILVFKEQIDFFKYLDKIYLIIIIVRIIFYDGLSVYQKLMQE